MSYVAAMKKPRMLIIVGPTASGKSALAVHLARRFKGEVISADSRQVYKGLTIGTGKISKREMKGIPHHLLDAASPKRRFSAGEYARRARRALDMIYHINKLPIVVGGTGFYIDALVGRIVLPDVPPDKKLRAQLGKKSAQQLFTLLKEQDPKRAKSMDTPSERNNEVRLIRAIEIAQGDHLSGQPGDMIYHITCESERYHILWIGVRPEDAELKRSINARLKQRMRAGMVDEAKRVHKAGLSYKRMRELGLEYRSLALLLQNKISEKEMVRELESDIWRYARKQIGYWKRNEDIRWFTPAQKTNIERVVRKWLEK